MSAIKNPAEGTPTIRVEIYNQTYNIRSDGDSEYVIGLGEVVAQDSRGGTVGRRGGGGIRPGWVSRRLGFEIEG